MNVYDRVIPTGKLFGFVRACDQGEAKLSGPARCRCSRGPGGLDSQRPPAAPPGGVPVGVRLCVSVRSSCIFVRTLAHDFLCFFLGVPWFSACFLGITSFSVVFLKRYWLTNELLVFFNFLWLSILFLGLPSFSVVSNDFL